MQLGGESAERGTSQISSWRKEWENRAAWVGCVPQPPPRLCPGAPSQALAAATAAQALWLFPLRSLWAFPSLFWGFGFIHPSLLAPSQQLTAGWQGLGRRPARSALPRQSGTTLASPQGSSSCAPLTLSPHPACLHRCGTDANTALCAWAGASSTILPATPNPLRRVCPL